MNMIFPFTVPFFATYCTKRTQVSISNIEHVLARVFNGIGRRQQKKKKKQIIRSNYFGQYIGRNNAILNNTQM